MVPLAFILTVKQLADLRSQRIFRRPDRVFTFLCSVDQDFLRHMLLNLPPQGLWPLVVLKNIIS